MVISLRTYLILLSILVIERFFELDLARRNARNAFEHGAIEVGQAHYRVMVAMHTLFIASCALEAIFFPTHFSPAVAWIALGAELCAQLLRYWAVSTLGERWNTRIIVDPARTPVTGGPYRFMRHPNYLAVVIEIAAVPMIGGALVTAIVFSIANAFVLAVRIPAEERALGGAYQGLFGSRSRFIPRFRHQ
ncbi:MAG: isoprenylcysteine carboxylmethyltransferase family protein [Candidatus Binatus sp.]|nr:isoprenylcysteine carboxylmethyltransferase family protein [Candidatus Binatus sp.]